MSSLRFNENERVPLILRGLIGGGGGVNGGISITYPPNGGGNSNGGMPGIGGQGGGGGEIQPPSPDIDDSFFPQNGYELGVWGIALTIIAALFTSTGLCLQKIVHRKVLADPSSGPVYAHSLYIAGLGYVSLGLLLKLVVDALIPQSTVAPLSSLGVMFSVILEYLFLDADMSWMSGAAVVLIAGISLLSTFIVIYLYFYSLSLTMAMRLDLISNQDS